MKYKIQLSGNSMHRIRQQSTSFQIRSAIQIQIFPPFFINVMFCTIKDNNSYVTVGDSFHVTKRWKFSAFHSDIRFWSEKNLTAKEMDEWISDEQFFEIDTSFVYDIGIVWFLLCEMDFYWRGSAFDVSHGKLLEILAFPYYLVHISNIGLSQYKIFKAIFFLYYTLRNLEQ